MRRSWVLVAMAAILAPLAAQAAPTDQAVLRHCLSHNPRKLALTPDQQARIEAIVQNEPDSPGRRARIMRVLTITQRKIFQDMAGVGLC